MFITQLNLQILSCAIIFVLFIGALLLLFDGKEYTYPPPPKKKLPALSTTFFFFLNKVRQNRRKWNQQAEFGPRLYVVLISH